jgi:MFS family permease
VHIFVLGFLVGVYYIAQFVSSFLIGHLSDRVGRRIPLTMGQIASCAGTILFALSPSYAIALTIRAAVGTNLPLQRSASEF